VKILVIGDPHGKLPKDLKGIVRKNKPDIIIVTGEIPPVPYNLFYPKYLLKKLKGEYDDTYSNKRYKILLDKLCSYKLPVIVFLGNAYVGDGRDYAINLIKNYKNTIFIQTGKVKIKNQNFVLFDMIWEDWAYKWSKPFSHRKKSKSRIRLEKFDKLMKNTKDPILVSHAPPYGYLDALNFPGIKKEMKGRHVGSKVVLRMIKKYKPKLVLCGHIHEGKGKVKIGKTKVINAGCRGDYFIINV